MSEMKEMKICAGCAVRWPHEHRCHGGNCQCIECAAVAAQAELTTLRAELAQVKANYTHLQDTSTQAGMELINERDGLRELLAQCQGELVDAEAKAFAAVLCIRCIEHISVPQQNSTEFSGGECGACIAAERDTIKQSHAKLLEDYENANAEADTLKGEVEKERALPAQLLDVHAICDQRDKAVQDRDSHRLLLDEMAGALAWLEEYFRRNIDVGGRHSCPWCYRKNEGHPWRTINHSPGCALAALTKYQQQCGEKVKV